MLLEKRVDLRLVRGGWWRVRGPSLWLESKYSWEVLGRVLRCQGSAIWRPLQAHAVSENVQRTQPFDGAKAGQRSCHKLPRQGRNQQASRGRRCIAVVSLGLLWLGLEGEQRSREGGEFRGEGHADGQDSCLDRL